MQWGVSVPPDFHFARQPSGGGQLRNFAYIVPAQHVTLHHSEGTKPPLRVDNVYNTWQEASTVRGRGFSVAVDDARDQVSRPRRRPRARAMPGAWAPIPRVMWNVTSIDLASRAQPIPGFRLRRHVSMMQTGCAGAHRQPTGRPWSLPTAPDRPTLARSCPQCCPQGRYPQIPADSGDAHNRWYCWICETDVGPKSA